MTLRLSEQHSYNDLTSIQAGVALAINLSNIFTIIHSIIMQKKTKNAQEFKKS